MRLNSFLSLIIALLLTAPAASVAQGLKPPPARNYVWRKIFERPSLPPGGLPDADKAALGQDLFRDTRLSGTGTASCASCHDAARAYTDGRPKGIGPAGAMLPRNVPSLYDLAWATSFFWDGRAPTLAAQARFPILAADELNGNFTAIVARLDADPEMRARFAKSFPEDPLISEKTLLETIAAFERSLMSPKSRFDRWVEGDDAALDAVEQQGFAIFVGKGGCIACHGGWRFTDGAYHDIGLAGTDPGRGGIEGGHPGLPQFKTPSLRELTKTAPYMHDGSKQTLTDVIDHYAGGLIVRPSLANALIRNLSLTHEEKAALVAFLKAVSSEPQPLTK
ncbi:MAG: cytochrome c peroxidase [Hyphomicrobium sp.]